VRGRSDETSQQPTHLHRYRCGYRYRYWQDEGNAGHGERDEENRVGGKGRGPATGYRATNRPIVPPPPSPSAAAAAAAATSAHQQQQHHSSSSSNISNSSRR